MFELRDALRRLDDETDYKYDLVGMYEATELSEPEKKLIAAMIADAKDPEEIAEELFKIFNTQNAMNMDEDCEPKREFKEVFNPSYDELHDGDEIIVGRQHLYVADAEYDDDYVWVTDEKEDRVEDINQAGKKEDKDPQFDAAIKAIRAYWNYDMSLEQLHNTLLKIYNNDAKKAFTVFATYGDAARRSKDECLSENFGKGEWQEVASKTVEDSDGFLTDYVWYTDGDRHVFIFGDSDIYRPEDGEFDWEIDIVKGREAESDKEAQEWFDSYEGFADLNEDTHAKVSKPEGDKINAYNNALKYAKKDGVPYCYGYTNNRVGKFFAFDKPFKWNGDDAAFRAKYKNTGTIYVAYPDNKFMDESIESMNEAQDIFDIQGQAVRDRKRKEILDEFREIFAMDENGEVNLDNEETLGYVRAFLEDQGYTVVVSESTNAEHPIHIEWSK